MNYPDLVKHAAEYITKKTQRLQEAAVGLVLGTGLGKVADILVPEQTINYTDIPGFPKSTVESHVGSLVIGRINGVKTYAMCGRFHLYEGYTPQEATFSIRVLGELGIKTLVLTNAAGAINPVYQAGGLMLIADHINMTGQNPLRGENFDRWGERFPDMSRVYCPKLLATAYDKSVAAGIPLERGVYIQVTGPCLETPAETRAFKRLGADAIGMSTVMEAICAKHMSMKILGISCLTNKNLPDCMAETSLEEIIAQAEESSGRMAALLEAVMPELVKE